MSWAKVSDDFTDDCWTLSDEAFRLHVEGLVWNGRKLLDCRIPKHDLRRFAKHPDAVEELLSCGWWTDAGNHYAIRHHAQYQRSREAVVAQQAANTRNGRKGGRPANPREQASELSVNSPRSDSVSDPISEGTTRRDRTGQAGTGPEPGQDFGFSSSLPTCRHGVSFGDKPDPWLQGLASCPQCRAQLAVS